LEEAGCRKVVDALRLLAEKPDRYQSGLALALVAHEG